MAGFALDHVALATRKVDAVCAFLGDALGLARVDATLGSGTVPFFAIGDAALGIFDVTNPYLDADASPGVHHMALRSSDPVAAADTHGLTLTHGGRGPDGRQFAAVDPALTCGIRTHFIEPSTYRPAASTIDRIDHLGIASNDNAACGRVFSDVLGCPIESHETDIEIRNVTESFVSDKYGAIYHARPPEILGGLRAMFISVGDCDLEIMMDYDPSLTPQNSLGEEAGNTKGDQSAIANFIARRGPGLAHVALQTQDIDGLLAKLAAQGWRLIDTVGRPGGRGSRIGFVHPSNFAGGLLIHFVEPLRP